MSQQLQQEIQQLRQEKQQIKDLLVNEVSARQQIAARLEQMSHSAQSMQMSFGNSLQAIRMLNKAGDKEAISAKIDSLIGPEPAPAPAPEQKEADKK